MRLYLAGPMTGIPEFNFPAFHQARGELREAGYDVACPAETTPETGHPWDYYMRRDIALLLGCEGVAVLPGWEQSKGASLEVHIAQTLGMPVRSLHDWLTDPRRNRSAGSAA